MAILLVNDVTPSIQYTATAGQTVFPYPFAIFADGDLKVFQTLAGASPDDAADLLTLTTHYTVSGAGATGGGDVTLVTGAALNDTITIVRDIPVKRLTDFQDNGDFLAETVNDELDGLTMMAQQIEQFLEERAMLFKRTDQNSGLDLTLPDVTVRKNQFLGFDANGKPVSLAGTTDTPISTAMAPVVNASTLLLARIAMDVATY